MTRNTSKSPEEMTDYGGLGDDRNLRTENCDMNPPAEEAAKEYFRQAWGQSLVTEGWPTEEGLSRWHPQVPAWCG
jgi:hypothetical protein